MCNAVLCEPIYWVYSCLFWSTGEILEAGIKNALLLQSDEAVVVTTQEEFDDTLPNGEIYTRTGGMRERDREREG